MTNEEISGLPAGRDLDLLVAEKVFGQVWQGGNPIPGYRGRWPWPYPYSTNFLAAWEVVEHFTEKMGIRVALVANTTPVAGFVQYECRVSDWMRGPPLELAWALAETMPLAVCRAALLAQIPNDG